MHLNLYEQRIIAGLVVIFIFTGILVFLFAIFYTDADDLKAAVAQMEHDRKLEQEIKTSRYMPKVTRWDFSIKLPVEGTAGEYHWMVKGAHSVNLTPHRQLIHQFIGETADSERPVRLISTKMTYDDREKELYTDRQVFADLGWGTLTGTGMVLRWARDIIEIRDDVEVTIIVAELPEEAYSSIASEMDSEEKEKKAGAKSGDNENAEEDRLVITSEKLKVFGREDRVVFTGNVVARDSRGTIEADEMEVQNFTKDEKKANPQLSGVKTVVCKGRVKIDLTDQAAKCHYAIFDSPTNIITLIGTEIDGQYVQVEYWSKKDEQQVLSDKMIINRETKEVEFVGNQKSTDFNPDKSVFLDFIGDEEEKKDTNGKDKGNETR